MTPPTPATLWGDLFAAVQESALFADSKTFADAVPLRPREAILADWRALADRDAPALHAFVTANFALPDPERHPAPDRLPLAEHIAALWPSLTRGPDDPDARGSLLPLPGRYVVPGGRFRELYYWDSYFTMLGLVRSGRQDLVEDMIADFGSLFDRFGHVPNGTRSYYASRSHPPVFYLMAALSRDLSPDARRRRLGWMRAEHAFWMAGADALAPGMAHRRVVRLPSSALLNRYWDDRAAPRDESWREDVALARAAPERVAEELWRDLRAAAESGWDFSARWLADGRSLATIRTTRLLPVDLNALLYGLEDAIARAAATLGEQADAARFARLADERREAIERHLWNPQGGFYADHDLDTGRVGDMLTGATAFPLFTGAAGPMRAGPVATALATLLRPGGLAATAARTGQQWDLPNGWAPLHWVAIEGLHAFGEDALAATITARWLTTVERVYRETGLLLEKYDVERGAGGGGGEYDVEIGFGWTNGVTLALLARQSGAGV